MAAALILTQQTEDALLDLQAIHLTPLLDLLVRLLLCFTNLLAQFIQLGNLRGFCSDGLDLSANALQLGISSQLGGGCFGLPPGVVGLQSKHEGREGVEHLAWPDETR